MAPVSVPACSFCHKDLALSENKQDSELPETIVISPSCGHLFHRTCIEKLLDNKKATSCKNKNCIEVIEKELLKEVNFEMTELPDASLLETLEATISSYKSLLKEKNTKITKLTTDADKLKQQITIKSKRLESAKKQNSLLVDQNKELQSKNEKYIETIEKLKLNKLQLEEVEKQKFQLVAQNKKLQTENNGKMELYKSQFEDVKKQNLQLADQNEKLQTENKEYIGTIEKLQERNNNTKTINKTSTNCEHEDLKHKSSRKIQKSGSKIKIDTIDKKITRRKMSCDDGKNIEIVTIDETETDETETDESETDETETDEEPESPKAPLRKSKFSSSDTDKPLAELQKIRGVSSSPLWLSPQRTSQDHEVRIMEEGKPRESKRSQNRENDRWDRCSYQGRETKKRTWHDGHQHRREYDSPENDVKRHKINVSSRLQKYLRPFSFTGRKFGPFLQVEYREVFAYTLGEYLLLGDGVINGILRTALHTDKHFYELLKRSPYYFSRRPIRMFDYDLKKLPYLPKKVMMSIGDMDSATGFLSYFELREKLQALFNTTYQKGVKEIVVIPPVKHNEWHERRYHLDFFLRVEASTRYDWKYHYMQELSKVMSGFDKPIKYGDMFYINSMDNRKLTEIIANYVARKRDDESDADT